MKKPQKNLNEKDQLIKDLIDAFERRTPPGTVLTLTDNDQIRKLAAKLGVLDRLQIEAPGCYSISTCVERDDVVNLIVWNSGSPDSKNGEFACIQIKLGPLSWMPGGFNLLREFVAEFLALIFGDPPPVEHDLGRSWSN